MTVSSHDTLEAAIMVAVYLRDDFQESLYMIEDLDSGAVYTEKEVWALAPEKTWKDPPPPPLFYVELKAPKISESDDRDNNWSDWHWADTIEDAEANADYWRAILGPERVRIRPAGKKFGRK